MIVTIRDVAKKLNLSITTVSRALDGYSDVAESTRKEVIRVAHEMGYIPNLAARQLRRRRADTIGYVLPTSQPRLSEPFVSEFVASLGDEANQQNMDLLIATAMPGDQAEQDIYRRWVQGRKVDGLVLNRTRIQDWRLTYLVKEKFPFVALERTIEIDVFPGCAFIEVDGTKGFFQLITHLVELGHLRIAYIGGPDVLKIQVDRLAGYQLGLAAYQIPVDPELIVAGRLTWQGGYEAALSLLRLSNPPTAITCINDQTAIGVYQAAQELGLVIGKELAIAGFDGTEEARHAQPGLTTIDQPLYDIARRLVMMLLTIIAGDPLPERMVKIEPVLLIRGSTRRP